MNGQNVTIIGNGIIGLAAAYHLHRAGFPVTVLDRAAVDEGTSIGNAGAVAVAENYPIAEPGLWKRVPGMLADPLGPLHFRLGHLFNLIPWMARFLIACRPHNYAKGIAALHGVMRHALDDHRAMLGDICAMQLLRHDGALFVHRTEQGLAKAETEWRRREREHGISSFKLDRDGLRKHEPALGPVAVGGYFSPHWATYRDPKELLVTLADHLRSVGVTFERGNVAALESKDGEVASLRLDDGRVMAVDNLLIAAGAWSSTLSAQLGETFPLEADRGYNTTLPKPGIDVKIYMTFVEDSFVVTPMTVGLRIGGAVEMGGLDAPPNFKRSQALLALGKKYLPDLESEGGTQWMGHRPGTPDSVPVISRSVRARNVVYAFGHGHLGLTMSVTTGRLVTALMAGQDTGIDMTPYRIDRFR